ncbi:MAG: 4Fe-4S dicluster domain-containing protein, partial [Gammaproteobacteria bacterium]|nr:4Fe-4S dicluster domain-containing protein [Gammaproteobacteria bacterium]
PVREAPLDPDFSDRDLAELLARPEFAGLSQALLPNGLSLEAILRQDCRIVECAPGDMIIREGDYGNSAFLLLRGAANVIVKPSLPQTALGRSSESDAKASLFQTFSRLWRRRDIPERRDDLGPPRPVRASQFKSLLHGDIAQHLFGAEIDTSVKEVPPPRPNFEVVRLSRGAIFGEIAALARVPRTATVYAVTDARIVEIRWQGLNVLRRLDPGWKQAVDSGYRNNQLKVQLKKHSQFESLSDVTIEKLAQRTVFESYGSFDWANQYQRSDAVSEELEPLIAREGDYADGLLMLTGGFARVAQKVGTGRRTLTYLRDGDTFAFDELHAAWKSGGTKVPLETTLSALGYVNLLRIPADVLEELVFPNITSAPPRLADYGERPLSGDGLLEWAVDNRFINATQAMVIDLEKCVRCDDCVRACASAHDGNPRFVRAGPYQGHSMVAHACMHCVDPVCMIGCPTGAIHRTQENGLVVINDEACIGCRTCANACPYDNIQMVELRDKRGDIIVDTASNMPILKATKCDLCVSESGGPACVNACPHGALERADFQDMTLFARR